MSVFDIVDNFKKTESIEALPIKITSLVNPKYTIAIPTYKRGKLIQDTLMSAMNQDTSLEYEVLVIDNDPERGSETEQYLENICDPRLSYYKNSENIGMVGNQNRCFTLAKGSFVLMIHDDDLLLPFCLSVYEKILQKNIDFAMITSNFYLMSNGVMPSVKNIDTIHLKEQKISHNWFNYQVGTPSGCLFDKMSMLKIGGFNQAFYPCFDYSLALLMMKHYPVYKINEKMFVYRWEVNESMSINTIIGSLEQDYYIRKEIESYVKLPPYIKRKIVKLVLGVRVRALHKQSEISEYKIDEQIIKEPGIIGMIVVKLLRFINRFVLLSERNIVVEVR